MRRKIGGTASESTLSGRAWKSNNTVNSQQSTVNNNSGATGIDMSDAVWVGSLPAVAFFKLVLLAQTDFIYLPDRARITPN